MEPILMTLSLVAALAVFGYSISTKMRLMARMAPENRLDQPRLGKAG